MNTPFENMGQIGLVPVIRIDDAADAVPLCDALSAGGLPVAEITFRTAAAGEAIARVVAERPRLLVGAGTVTSLDLARQAKDAGARYIVTPGFNPPVVDWCLEQGVPVLPGCTTASEVEMAQERGLEVVKFFPAEQSGGLARIRALAGPYHGMRYVPTGGIGPANLVAYLNEPRVVACGGSFMVNDALVRQRDWLGITELTRQAMALVLGLEVRAVRLAGGAAVYQGLLGGCGITCGEGCNELDFVVHSVERAVWQFERQGAEIDAASVQRDARGHLVCATLAEPLDGFTVRLIRGEA